jgi:segregation and condensation protein A
VNPTPPEDQEFLVELPVFSGPFRLLAELILDQRVDVCDVPVATLTDGFLRRGVREMPTWSLEDATWFLAVCALMLELKVGRLLPRPSVETEEDLLGGASPDLLYARTIELAALRDVAESLALRIAEAEQLVPRTVGPPPEFAHLYPDVLAAVSAEDLQRLAVAMLRPPPALDLSHVTPIRASVEGALASIRERLALLSEARFRDLLEDASDRIQVVVRFLALLELHRQGEVELLQAERFGEIEIRRMQPSVEREAANLEPHGWDDPDQT